MLLTGYGRSVLGKTMPSVSSTALGLRPRPMNNIYVSNFVPLEAVTTVIQIQ